MRGKEEYVFQSLSQGRPTPRDDEYQYRAECASCVVGRLTTT